MYKKSKLAKSVRLAAAFGAASMLVATSSVVAQEESLERIAITGSTIKRTDIEGALPVMTLSSDDIVKTGVTSVPDLIQKLPSMQGMIAPSQSVGGGGAGQAEAALRGLTGDYTLVLLNGKRIASADSGSSVDVNSIPIAAIERVEILTDGASALYGSDAIAGVINFIMKKDIQETTVSARYDAPQDTGGDNLSFSLSTGYGDIATDGFNVYFTYSREAQEQLASKDRDHSRTGIIPFNHNGDDVVFVADSLNAIPANALLWFNDGTQVRINPYRESNGGQCGPNSAPSDLLTDTLDYRVCRFDFTSTLEIVPEYTRDNFMLGGVAELGDSAELYATASYSIFEQVARIAPYPTGGFGVDPTSALFQTEVYPYLPADAQAMVDAGEVALSLATWRALPGGNRTNEFATDTLHLDLGVRGEFGEFSYDVSVTYSDATREDNVITGYPIEEQFISLLESGGLNVFGLNSDLTEEEITALQGTMFSGNEWKNETDLLTLSGSFSTPAFELPAGTVYVGGGFDYRESSYKRVGSLANQAAVILFADPDSNFDLERETYGLFLETIVPVFEGFEVTAAIRYDDISAVTNTVIQNPVQLADFEACQDQEGCAPGSALLLDENDQLIPNGFTSDVGTDLNDTTYKLSASYRPNDNWLLRASVGTGFRAPSMRQIAEPLIPFGVTGGVYQCPFNANNQPDRVQYCRGGNDQYDVFRRGNAELQPEESEQMAVGLVYSQGVDFNFSIDYWQIEMTNQARRPTEREIFDGAAAGDQFYIDMFTTKFDEGRSQYLLAIVQEPQNLGETNVSGIDWSVDFSNDLNWASLKTEIAGTYMLANERSKPGIPGEFDTSLGLQGNDDQVVFRNRFRVVNTLSHGDFSHVLSLNYQSGWTDENFPGGDGSIRVADENDITLPTGTIYTGGVQLRVPSHVIVDWLTTYNYNDDLTVAFGISNLTDNLPPLALGENGGHQEGFDPRYYESYGRTFYLQANYTF